jgi:drug/metabolite transporter (DMT)-like permease
VGSFVFQALALHNGPMSVVQPLLITELVFTLVLRRVWIHQDVARAAWASVSVVCVALAVFLAVGEPTGDSRYARRPWLRRRQARRRNAP